jgi:transcriptional regulator with XRE-family HTH domain
MRNIPLGSLYPSLFEYAIAHNENMSTFAKRAKERRIELDLTQGQVAARSGLNQSDISKIERGLIHKTTELLGLAVALECSPKWLSSGDGDKNAGVQGFIFRPDQPAEKKEPSFFASAIGELFDMLPNDMALRSQAFTAIQVALEGFKKPQRTLEQVQSATKEKSRG